MPKMRIRFGLKMFEIYEKKKPDYLASAAIGDALSMTNNLESENKLISEKPLEAMSNEQFFAYHRELAARHKSTAIAATLGIGALILFVLDKLKDLI